LFFIRNIVLVFVMKNIAVRNTRALGAAVKARRLELGWSQEVLANHLGVQRQWVIRFEAGSDGAEIGTVLKSLTALGLSIVVGSELARSSEQSAPASNLDDVFARLATPVVPAKSSLSVRPRSKNRMPGRDDH
jgi:transcriptional regulator with XRE-family HTH domain